MQGKQFLLWSIINYLWFGVPSKSIFEINSKNTEVSIKKVDCPTDSWLIDTYLCNFYSLIIALDSVEKNKLWSTLNWPQLKLLLGLHSGMQRMKNPGSLLKLSLTHTLPPTPQSITPWFTLIFACIIKQNKYLSHVLWATESQKPTMNSFLFPWCLRYTLNLGMGSWVLNKHRTVETIKLVIDLLLLIPPASWWNLSKLAAGWVRRVIKHNVNCWALQLYSIYIYLDHLLWDSRRDNSLSGIQSSKCSLCPPPTWSSCRPTQAL